MLIELRELNKKINEISAFIGTKAYNNLDEYKRVLIFLQESAMEQYAAILAYRCKAEGISEKDVFGIL